MNSIFKWLSSRRPMVSDSQLPQLFLTSVALHLLSQESNFGLALAVIASFNASLRPAYSLHLLNQLF